MITDEDDTWRMCDHGLRERRKNARAGMQRTQEECMLRTPAQESTGRGKNARAGMQRACCEWNHCPCSFSGGAHRNISKSPFLCEMEKNHQESFTL